MARARLAVLAVAFAGALLAAACERGASARPRRSRAAQDASPAVTAPSPPPPGRGARVVVDVSESNRGFASERSAALESLHRVLDAALSAHELNNPFQRCTLDTALHCPTRAMPPQAFRAPALYDGRFAALHRVLRRAPRAARVDLQAEDPLDPYAVTVLVTDGFQSTSSAFQPSQSEDVACAAGADPSCVAALLRRRVDDGYGVWVVRLWMPFDGRYFAERRLDASMWRRVQDHVAELNRDPAWTGVTFAAREANLASDTGPFRFSGARPLLLFVLSREHARARRFVADVARRLRVERLTLRGRDEDVAASEWAPFEGLSATVQRAARADHGGAADAVLVERATRAGATLTVPIGCTLAGRARVRLDGVVAEGAIPPPPFARVELAWRMLSRAGREVTVPSEPVRPAAGPFTTLVGVDCTSMPAGAFAYELALWGRWTLDDAAAASEWFVRESADTSYEAPERMFGLGDLARAVLASGLARDGALDRVALRLRRD